MKKGISLVALVITIIVLIILTSAIMIMFNNGGILGRAEEAVFKNDVRAFQESLVNSITQKQLELVIANKNQVPLKLTYQEILEYIPIFTQKYENKLVIHEGNIKYIRKNLTDKEIQWCIELGIEEYIIEKIEGLKIGDTIRYVPNSEEKYTLEKDNRNLLSWVAVSQEIERQDNLTWKVMKIEDNGNITLLGEPTSAKVNLYAIDYLFGEEKLNNICEALYSYTYNGKTYKARSINLDDIVELVQYDKYYPPHQSGTPLYEMNEQYGNNTYYINTDSEGNTVNISNWNTLSQSNWPSDLYLNFYNPVQAVLHNFDENLSIQFIEITDQIDDELKTRLLLVKRSNYWIATKAIADKRNMNYAEFGLYATDLNSNINVALLYRSSDENVGNTNRYSENRIRPVITLPAHIVAEFIEN